MKRHASIIAVATLFAAVIAGSGIASAQYINGTTLPPATGPTDDTCLPMGKGIGLAWSYCDVASTLFSYVQVDMSLPGPMPIVLERFYRSEAYNENGTAVPYPFGSGTNFNYNIYLWSESEDASGTLANVDLIEPDGGRVFCGCTGSSCTPPSGSEFKCTATANQTFYSATIQYVASPQSWLLTTKDGTKYTFRYETDGTGPGALLQSIADRYGNQITLTRNPVQTGNITQISSSNGRYINLTYGTYGGNSVITKAEDNAGRTTAYQYNTSGWMTQSTDLNGYNTAYTWFTPVDLASITLLDVAGTGGQNEETQIGYTQGGTSWYFTYLIPPGNQGYYQIAYNVYSQGHAAQADISDPNLIERDLAFNSSGYLTSETLNANGTPSETTTYTRNASNNFVTDKIDPLGRDTHYGYDFTTTNYGNLLSETRLYGTSNPITTNFTYYNSIFQLLDTVKDPLGHITTFGVNSSGELTSFEDADGNTWTFPTYNAQGQVLTIMDPLKTGTTTFGYDPTGTGDLTSITYPTGNATEGGYDGAGRLTSTTDSLRNTTTYKVDGVGNVTQITDADGGVTKYQYDAAVNLQSVTDPNTHTVVTNTYDVRNRLLSSCDALGNCSSYKSYDPDDNLLEEISGTSVQTNLIYDGLNRLIETDYDVGGSSPRSVKLTYDLGDRLLTAVDSIGGTFTRQYGTSATSLASGLDFMTEETSPQGTVSYTPDTAGRRQQMIATMASYSQTTNYSYDNANKLKQVTPVDEPGSVIGYDADSRRQTVTLPNGVVITYGYDPDSNVKSITYKNGSTTLGNLTYEYDPDDRRFNAGGSLASTAIPTAQTFSYNNDNSLKTFGSSTVTNDKDGAITCLYSNLCNTSSHAGTFSWDAAGQLQEAIGPGPDGLVYTEEAGYDPFGRRIASATWIGANGPFVTTYLYDGLNPIQENAGVTGVSTTLLAGLALDDDFSSGTDGVPAESFLTDPLNSLVATTDSSGNIDSSCTYEPYGYSPQFCDFIGRENDSDGLYFLRSRYYAPELGRFISRDPAGFGGGGTNLYAYSGDDPVNFSDPMGREYGFPVGGGSYGFYNGVFGNNGGGGGGYYGGTGGVGIIGANAFSPNGDGVFYGVTLGVGWFGASIGGFGGSGLGMGPAKPLPNLDGIYNVVLHGHNGAGLEDVGFEFPGSEEPPNPTPTPFPALPNWYGPRNPAPAPLPPAPAPTRQFLPPRIPPGHIGPPIWKGPPYNAQQ